MGIISLVRSLFEGKGKSGGRVSRPRPTVRPRLEPLEDRLLLATFQWLGATSTDWSDATNWKVTVGAGTYPGAKGSTDDIVLLDDGAKKAVKLNENLTIQKLTLSTTFTLTLEIEAGKSLTVTDSAFLQGGKLNFAASDAALNLTGGLNRWEGTDINSGGKKGGTVYLYGSGALPAQLRISGDAQKLGAYFVIGQDSKGNDSAATVLFATADVPLNNNVTLSNDAQITIYKMGVVYFSQNKNSDTSGGIDVAAGSVSEITSTGKIVRDGVDPDGKYLQIVPLVNAYAGSTLDVKGNCRIEFVNEYIQNDGTCVGYDKTRIKGFVKKGGKVSLNDPGTPGVYTVYIDGDFQMTGGSVVFNDVTPGSHGVLSVSGSFLMSAGSVSVPNGDAIDVGGSFQQSGGALDLNGATLAALGAYVEYSGVATLENGTVNASSVQVAAGAVLSGYGAVNSNVTNAGEVDAGGPSALAVSGNYTQTAGLTRVSSAGLNVGGSLAEQGGSIVLNSSSLQAGGGVQVMYSAAFSGSGTVVANVQNAGEIDEVNGGLSVTGAFTQTAGVTNLTNGGLFVTGLLDEQGGTFNLLNGFLQAYGGYHIESAAALVGTGQITADVTNSGLIEVGGLNQIGTLMFQSNSSAGIHGNLTLTSTSSLDMEIAGPSASDAVFAAGLTTLGGALHVHLLNGFTPTHGETFPLLSGLTSGQFALLDLPTFAGGLFVPEYGSNGFSLWVQ